MMFNLRLHVGRHALFGLTIATLAAACSDDDARLSPESLPQSVVGSSYEATITAEDFDETPTWAIVAGGLPPGLEGTPDENVWRISGTAVTPGSFQFLLRAEGGDDRAERLYRINIFGNQRPLEITTDTLPPATIGLAYQALLTAEGGTETGYTWEAEGLPTGLSLAREGSNTAQISGTPTTAGQSDVVVRVRDDGLLSATATLTLVVREASASLEITTPSLPGATRGLPYEATITAQGGSGQGYTWGASTLPPGLELVDGTPSATLRGTPSQEEPGQLATTITVTDSTGATFERDFTLSVNNPRDLVISPRPFPDGAVDEAYEVSLTAVGGVPPYAWSIGDGSLPTDLALQPSTTATTSLSGSPSEPGTFNFTVQVEDALGATAERPVELFIQPAPLEIDPALPPMGAAGVGYSATIEADGGAAPFSWRVSAGMLPPGLSLQSTTSNRVTISGVPLAVGTFDATIEVEDDLGATDDQAFNFIIGGSPNPLDITTEDLPDAVVGEGYIANVDAEGGTETDFSWRVSGGELPPGLSLLTSGTPSTLLVGVPTSTGTFDFTVEVSDSANQTGFQAFTITSTRTSTIP